VRTSKEKTIETRSNFHSSSSGSDAFHIVDSCCGVRCLPEGKFTCELVGLPDFDVRPPMSSHEERHGEALELDPGGYITFS